MKYVGMNSKIGILGLFTCLLLIQGICAKIPSPVTEIYSQQIFCRFNQKQFRHYLIDKVIGERRFLFIVDQDHAEPLASDVYDFTLKNFSNPDHCVVFLEGMRKGAYQNKQLFGLEDEILYNLSLISYILFQGGDGDEYYRPSLYPFIYLSVSGSYWEKWWYFAQAQGFCDSLKPEVVNELNRLIALARQCRGPQDDFAQFHLIKKIKPAIVISARDLWLAHAAIGLAAARHPDTPQEWSQDINHLFADPTQQCLESFQRKYSFLRSMVFIKNIAEELPKISYHALIVVHIGAGHWPDLEKYLPMAIEL